MDERPHTHALYLDHKEAPRRTWQLASLLVGLLFLTFAALLPVVAKPLTASAAFIPAYEASLVIIELLTAVVLLGQYLSGAGSRLLILGCGYLYNALIIVAHALSFPGAFGPHGIIGGGPQTTAWLYIFWHGGFPLFVLAFAAYGNAAPVGRKGRTLRTVLGSAGVLALAALLALLATSGHSALPVVIENGNYRLLVELGISPTLIALCVVALITVLCRKTRSVLDVWLGAVLIVWIFDITMSAVIGTARYDLGWYAGRLFGLVAGGFVLGVLLIEANLLHGNLAQALRDAEDSKAKELASREELARGQRLEAMGQLTGGIAHDFNNVLQVIGASMGVLKFKLHDRPDAVDLIERALTAVNRGARLSGELLSFGRRQPLQPRVVDVATLVEAMAEVARRTLGQAIAVTTKVELDLWRTMADPSRLENALLNLILNSRDAIAENGTITLGAENVRQGFFDFSQFADVPPGDYVRLTVQDDGKGIPEEVLPHVLEPFFSTKTMAEGTGLGLSMVHGFAKQSSGHLGIQSTIGEGTCVSLFLPRSRGKVERTMQAPTKMAGGTETILVVEDMADVRHGVVQILDALGYRVLQADAAHSALAILESEPVVDILFSDVIMPGPVRTADMARRAKDLHPALVVLFTSGYVENVIGRAGILDKDVHLLSKPYSPDTLASRLRTLLDSRTSAAV